MSMLVAPNTTLSGASTIMTEANPTRTHEERSRSIQAAQAKKQAKATREKGLLIVHTGPGKGKTSAAMGMGIRVVGHGQKLAVVQFIKGAMASAERDVVSKLPGVEWHTIGDGFTWNTQDREADIATARRAWEQALLHLEDPTVSMVILDELNIVLAHKYLPVDEVLEGFARRHGMMHVVVTGRGAPEALIDAADLVSRIESPKHPFQAGIKAQAGVEF
jgi:cob(I)alamin adenosyltransferase